MIEWVQRDKSLPESAERVLTYSSGYEEIRKGHEMTYRIMDGQFVRICIDVTHWARLDAPLS